jgi:putative membrane protein
MRLFVGTVLFMLLAFPLYAQKGNPAFTEPETRQAAPGTPAAHETNPQDQLFAELAAMSGLAEVQLAELANGKSQSGDVKDFAALMIGDHGKANGDLARLAKAARIRLPDAPSPEHKAAYAQLKGLDGGEFDRAYMRNQLQEHQKAAILLEWEINAGQDALLQRFASQTLPVVLRHLEVAQKVKASLTQTASR